MSARDKLVELVLKNEPDHGNIMFINLDGHAMSAEEMKGSVLLWLDAYRAEVLREAAEELRKMVADRPTADLMRMFFRGAANVIDPDTP